MKKLNSSVIEEENSTEFLETFYSSTLLRSWKSIGGDSGRFALEKTSDSFDKYDNK